MAILGTLIEQVRGVSYKPEDLHTTLNENSVTLLRANNIKDGKLNFDDVVYVDKRKVSEKQLLKSGDILICASSGSKELVGKAAYVAEDMAITFGTFCKVVRPKTECPQYIGHFFNSPYYRERIANAAAGANINNIRNEHIDVLEIAWPSLEEQQDAVAVLDKVIELIAQRKEQLTKLDQLIKSRFIELFGDPKANNRAWRMNTFADICSVRQGLQIPISKRLTRYEEGCYEYITVAYLHGSKEREYIKNPKSTVICTENDILMTRTGNTGMVITNVAGVFHNNFFLIDFDRTRYNKVFLAEYLNLDLIQAEIKRKAGTSTIPDLNHGEFYAISIYEPPIELQNQFAVFVEQTDKSKVAIQQSLDKLELLKKSLMQEYFG